MEKKMEWMRTWFLYSNGCMRPCATEETPFISYFGQIKSNYMLKAGRELMKKSKGNNI